MAIFNIFAFGTGEDSQKTRNIISQFAKACENAHLMINGPDFLGHEVKHNAEKASRQIVNWLNHQDSTAHSINLTGFSRGSITCNYIANYLKQYETYLQQNQERLNQQQIKLLMQLKTLNIHLFAIDPVAGMMDKHKLNARIIPDNVKNYVAILQMDEMRREFKPQDMTRVIITSPETTRVSMLPMYGNHSDNVRIKTPGMQSGATLTWNMLYQFLQQHGTQFKEGQMPPIINSYNDNNEADLKKTVDAKGLLKLFTAHHLERDNYLISGRALNIRDGLPMPRISRTLNKHLHYYVKQSAFFTNQLERELFKLAYPKTFNYLFEKNQMDIRFPHDSASSTEDVIKELALLRREDAHLFKRLHALNITFSAGKISLGNPQGYYFLEPCTSTQQIFPHLVPELVKQHASAINKLSMLEKDIYQLCFRYEREKWEINFNGTRTQATFAKKIRNEVNHFINSSPQNHHTKYAMILNKIEQHYIHLIQIDSASELKSMLRNLLNKYGRTYQIQQNSLPNAALLGLIEALFFLIKQCINFIGHFGYLGGAALTFIGIGLEDLGRRINEVLGDGGYHPLKEITATIAALIEMTGFAVKKNLGVKTVAKILIQEIDKIQNALIILLNTTKVASGPAHVYMDKIILSDFKVSSNQVTIRS